MFLSERAGRLAPQPMFEILSRANYLDSLGRDIVHLEIGDTSSDVLPGMLEALASIPLYPGTLGYSPSAGEWVLRERLIALHNEAKNTALGVNNVAVLPANAAVTHLLSLLADPGDSVVLMDPCFPTYRLAAHYLDLNVRSIPLMRRRGYSMDLSSIIALVESASPPVAVLIDSPSNPVGIAHSPQELSKLASVCDERGVALIIDETYRNLIYQDGLSPDRLPESVIWIYSLSKDAGAPGIRIGSVVGPEALISKVSDLSSLTFSCSPKFFQLAAANYLSSPSAEIDAKKEVYRQRIEDLSFQITHATGLPVAPANSSIYLWIDISRTGMESRLLAHRLLEEAGVAVCPGEGFGPSGVDHIRITIAGNGTKLEDGVSRILSFLARS